MKILFLGDVVGSVGRKAIQQQLQGLRDRWQLDFVVVNAENATNGRGLSSADARALLDSGVDCITLGDHAFDQREMVSHISREPRILRPLNYGNKHTSGQGSKVFTTAQGRKVMVLQALGRVFMNPPVNDPFEAVNKALALYRLGHSVDAIIVDIHGEATSEKMAMGHFCDGRVSLVAGTHTHIPTADTQKLPKGTAFQCDTGMCGDYNSVIGMDIAVPLQRFVSGMPVGRLTPANGEATLSGVYVETDPHSGLVRQVFMVRQGGRLQQAGPPSCQT